MAIRLQVAAIGKSGNGFRGPQIIQIRPCEAGISYKKTMQRRLPEL